MGKLLGKLQQYYRDQHQPRRTKTAKLCVYGIYSQLNEIMDYSFIENDGYRFSLITLTVCIMFGRKNKLNTIGRTSLTLCEKLNFEL